MKNRILFLFAFGILAALLTPQGVLFIADEGDTDSFIQADYAIQSHADVLVMDFELGSAQALWSPFLSATVFPLFEAYAPNGPGEHWKENRQRPPPNPESYYGTSTKFNLRSVQANQSGVNSNSECPSCKLVEPAILANRNKDCGCRSVDPESHNNSSNRFS